MGASRARVKPEGGRIERGRKLVESIEATIWYLERLSVGGRYQTIRDLARAPNKSKMKGIEIARFAASVGRWETDIKVSIGTRRGIREVSTIKDTAISQGSLQLSSTFLLSGDFSEDSRISDILFLFNIESSIDICGYAPILWEIVIRDTALIVK